MKITSKQKTFLREELSSLTSLPSLLFSILTLGSLIIIPHSVFANSANPPGTLNTALHLPNPLQGTTTLDAFMNNVLGGVILVLTPFVVIMVIYSGLLFVTARGNTEKLSEAKKMLIYTLIGAVIVLGAIGIKGVIANTVASVLVPPAPSL